jgi:small subunit ribosomal protein S8
MSKSDLLADVLTRIRNGQNARHAFVTAPSSNLVKSVLSVMLEEGYIKAYEEFAERPGINMLKIDLKYHKGLPVIEEVVKVSKSGRRFYSKVEDMKQMYGGLGIMIVSTSKGVVSDMTAKKLGVGGEVLCKLF